MKLKKLKDINNNNDESFKLEKLKDLIQLTEENNIKTNYDLNLSNM